MKGSDLQVCLLAKCMCECELCKILLLREIVSNAARIHMNSLVLPEITYSKLQNGCDKLWCMTVGCALAGSGAAGMEKQVAPRFPKALEEGPRLV